MSVHTSPIELYWVKVDSWGTPMHGRFVDSQNAASILLSSSPYQFNPETSWCVSGYCFQPRNSPAPHGGKSLSLGSRLCVMLKSTSMLQTHNTRLLSIMAVTRCDRITCARHWL